MANILIKDWKQSVRVVLIFLSNKRTNMCISIHVYFISWRSLFSIHVKVVFLNGRYVKASFQCVIHTENYVKESCVLDSR